MTFSSDQRLFCKCGIEVRITRLVPGGLGHVTNPTYRKHPIQLLRQNVSASHIRERAEDRRDAARPEPLLPDRSAPPVAPRLVSGDEVAAGNPLPAPSSPLRAGSPSDTAGSRV